MNYQWTNAFLLTNINKDYYNVLLIQLMLIHQLMLSNGTLPKNLLTIHVITQTCWKFNI